MCITSVSRRGSCPEDIPDTLYLSKRGGHAGRKKTETNSGANALRLKQKNNSVHNQQTPDNQVLSSMTPLTPTTNDMPAFL